MRRGKSIAGLWFLSGCLGVSLLNPFNLCGWAQSPASPQQASPAQDANAQGSSASPQLVQHPAAPLSIADYDYLLDVLFPIDHALPPAVDYVMVLRFEPHLHPESQIVIRHYHQGRIEANLTEVASGSAWKAAYQQLVPGESPNFQAIASNIQLRDSKFRVDPQQLEAWHKEIFPVLAKQSARVRNIDKSLRSKGNHEIATMGTRYEFWFIQMNDEEHMVAWGSESESVQTGTSALTQWMNKVRLSAVGPWRTSTPPHAAVENALPMSSGTMAQPVASEPVPALPVPTAVQPGVMTSVQPAAAAVPTPAATVPATAANPVFPQPGHPETMSGATSGSQLGLAPVQPGTPAQPVLPAQPTTAAQQPAPAAAPASKPAGGDVLHPVYPQPGH